MPGDNFRNSVRRERVDINDPELRRFITSCRFNRIPPEEAEKDAGRSKRRRSGQ